MASPDACRPCEARSKSASAKYWCVECHDLLCEDCYGLHRVMKSSNNHTVISIENYRKLPVSVLNISPLCQDHGLKYYHFCTHHETPCCLSCVASSHKGCPDLQLLDEVIKRVKTSSLIDEVEKSMKTVKSNIETIISDRGQNITVLQKQLQKIKEKIANIRKKVNQHIDKLEKKMLSELAHVEESGTKQIQQLVVSLTNKLATINKKLKETTVLKMHASDLQTFLCTRELEKVIKKEKTCIEYLARDGSLKIQELHCSVNDKIQAIISDIQTFGSVSVISKPSTVCLKFDKDKQTSMLLPTPQPKTIKIEDAIITLKSKSNIQGVMLRGCSVFPNDKVVLADFSHRRVIILTDSGTKENEIHIIGGPNDVTVIDNRTIAVSTEKGIQIIDVNTDTANMTFNIGPCGILSYHDGVMYICGHKGTQDIVSINLSTGKQESIIQNRHSNYSYCVVAGDQLYYTRADKRGLQCYSIKGETKWEYENTTLINYPVSATVDGSGNVYLASCHNHQILMISPDGKWCRPILFRKDGIVHPRGLCYNKNKNELFVTCEHGQFFRFEIQ